MAIGILGADSDTRITYPQIVSTATQAIAPHKLQFWGRYFKKDSLDDAHYSKQETPTFQKNAYSLLCFARETPDVGGCSDDGRQWATWNVDAFFSEISAQHVIKAAACGELLFFLDVEPTCDISKEFYSAWSATLMAHSSQKTEGKVKFMPGVYLNGSENKDSIRILNDVCNSGGVCSGLIVAYYPGHTPPEAPVDWDLSKLGLSDLTSIPVLAWQYAGDRPPNEHLDYIQVNPDPNLEKFFLRRLITPG